MDNPTDTESHRQVANFKNMPQIFVDIPDDQNVKHERRRNLSNSSKNSSSCGSIPSSMESVDSHQRTVTSITPLLSTTGSIPNMVQL